MGKETVKGAVFVALGAIFYGVLGNVIKLAYRGGYTTAEVLAAQYAWGLVGLWAADRIVCRKQPGSSLPVSGRDRRRLMLAGLAIGVTSTSYYISMRYVDVSVAIVLMMQSVWFGIVLESMLQRRLPSGRKAWATVVILIGTVLATNMFGRQVALDIRGVLWGLLSGATFTFMMYASNRIATHVPPYRKSLLMLLGGSLVVAAFIGLTQVGPHHVEALRGLVPGGHVPVDGSLAFRPSIFLTYGPVIALFGTILPPILFNIGFPKVGLGLGSIVSSLELPVSVTVAYLVLHEQVLAVQWAGIFLILAAIAVMNRGGMRA
ncbi:MAG: EamA family transporter [Flavobacteriales bacterium]|nr:EamA family transporter [Flavobacteriales bacterium]MCL4281650.1 EamA family transporter [Flavobacteriales bacterium]